MKKIIYIFALLIHFMHAFGANSYANIGLRIKSGLNYLQSTKNKKWKISGAIGFYFIVRLLHESYKNTRAVKKEFKDSPYYKDTHYEPTFFYNLKETAKQALKNIRKGKLSFKQGRDIGYIPEKNIDELVESLNKNGKIFTGKDLKKLNEEFIFFKYVIYYFKKIDEENKEFITDAVRDYIDFIENIDEKKDGFYLENKNEFYDILNEDLKQLIKALMKFEISGEGFSLDLEFVKKHNKLKELKKLIKNKWQNDIDRGELLGDSKLLTEKRYDIDDIDKKEKGILIKPGFRRNSV